MPYIVGLQYWSIMAKIDLEFNQNEDEMKFAVANLNKQLDVIALGGGIKKIEKQHAKGKMTARERVAFLVDDHQDFYEIGAFAGHEMYPEYGGNPIA